MPSSNPLKKFQRSSPKKVISQRLRKEVIKVDKLNFVFKFLKRNLLGQFFCNLFNGSEHRTKFCVFYTPAKVALFRNFKAKRAQNYFKKEKRLLLIMS